MTKYNELPYYRTRVEIAKTQAEIRKLLGKYGLQGIRLTEYKNNGIIEFILLIENRERLFRFSFNTPERESHKKQAYRGLLYYLKARFSAVDFGIRTIEEEFMPEIVMKLPEGGTATVKEIVGNGIGGLEFASDLQLPYKEER